MKGVIPDCLGKLIKSRFGKDKWAVILEAAGLPRSILFLPTEDISDSDVFNVVESTCKVLNMSLQEAADAFGEYWINEYAPNMYKGVYRQSNSAKEFLLNMDKVHIAVTKNMPNAHPPRFTYSWPNDRTLIMTYKSSRKLIDFMIGLIKGVGGYYKENLQVVQLEDNRVQITF